MLRTIRHDSVIPSTGAVCAVLAAGRSSRMGRAKPLLRAGGETFLARAVRAAGGRPVVVVAGTDLDPDAAGGAGVVVNARPDLGMSRSLALANEALGRSGEPLVVLLADTPLVDADLVDAVLAALGDADVAFPERDGVPGHPVVFGPRARARIAGLPPGDTLRRLRDAPDLVRARVAIGSDAPFADVDTPEEFAAVELRLRGSNPGAHADA